MSFRSVEVQLKARLQREGGGFTVNRAVPQGKSITDRHADPFLMVDEWGPKTITYDTPGNALVAHRGHDMLTYFKAGGGGFTDTAGNDGVIGEGCVQWLSAGNGVELEMGKPVVSGPDAGASKTDHMFHAFQVWVNIPKDRKKDDPSYQALPEAKLDWQSYTAADSNGVRLKVLAGQMDVSGKGQRVISPIQTSVPVLILDMELTPGGHATLPIPADWTCIVYVYCGGVRLSESSEEIIGRMECALMTAGDALRLVADDGEEGAHLLVCAGKPLREPIATAGGLVCSDPAGVMNDLKDHRSGKFFSTKAPIRQL